MKKITLLLLFIVLGFAGYSQSLVANGATTPLAGDEITPLDAEVWIVNSSAISLDVLVQRTVNNLATGHTSNFCWGLSCYGDTTNWATDPVTIPAGDSSHSFHGYLNPHGYFGQSHVCYKYFDMNNSPDFVEVCYDYDIATGIHVLGVTSSDPLSSASPSPAYGLTNINYLTSDINSRIIIYNLLGVVVKEIKLESKQGVLILSTSDMKQGVYYYSLISGDKTLATKKLVVAHK